MSENYLKYRKLFRQQSVLDTFRLYLDVTDSFLGDMNSQRLLHDEQYQDIKRLPFPARKNQFLHMLVRMRWTKEKFDKFSQILRSSQSQEFIGQFCNDVTLQADESFEPPSRRSIMTSLSIMTSPSDYELLLDSMSSTARCAVHMMLKERDDVITKLTLENKRLNDLVEETSFDLEDEILRSSSVEKLLTDWLAELSISLTDETPSTHPTSEMKYLKSALEQVSVSLSKYEEIIFQQNEEIMSLKSTVGDLKSETEKKEEVLEELRETVGECAPVLELTVPTCADIIDSKLQPSHLTVPLNFPEILIKVNYCEKLNLNVKSKSTTVLDVKSEELSTEKSRRISEITLPSIHGRGISSRPHCATNTHVLNKLDSSRRSTTSDGKKLDNTSHPGTYEVRDSSKSESSKSVARSSAEKMDKSRRVGVSEVPKLSMLRRVSPPDTIGRRCDVIKKDEEKKRSISLAGLQPNIKALNTSSTART